jgi:sec-independent protein translocase protein TatC
MSRERKSDLEGLPESAANDEARAEDANRPEEDSVPADPDESADLTGAEETDPDGDSREPHAADAPDSEGPAERPDDSERDESARDDEATVDDTAGGDGDGAGHDSAAGDQGEPTSQGVAVPSGSVPAQPGAGQQDADAAPPEDVPQEMTFTEHLNELRIRLVRCIIAAFVGLLVCYPFAEELFRVLMAPLIVLLEPAGGSLIYTGLPEAFFTHLKVAAIAGLFVASPYVFYQLWMFIAPGLYEGERKYIIPIAFFSAAFFVTGALFGYFIVFPFGFDFFLGYASDLIKPMPSVREYFSFSTSMLFAFGLIFELPLFIFFLSVMGIVTHVSLRKFRKFAILGSFLVSAVLTPPDVISQCFMAGPLCILYEIGIWVAYVFGRKPKKAEAEEEEQAKA